MCKWWQRHKWGKWSYFNVPTALGKLRGRVQITCNEVWRERTCEICGKKQRKWVRTDRG
jgi:hypothetical protein